MKRRDGPVPPRRRNDQPGRERALREFKNTFETGNEGYRISVYRLQDGQLKCLGSHPASGVDEVFVQEVYGAGKYTLKLIDGRGRWISQATIGIAEKRRQFRGNS